MIHIVVDTAWSLHAVALLSLVLLLLLLLLLWYTAHSTLHVSMIEVGTHISCECGMGL